VMKKSIEIEKKVVLKIAILIVSKEVSKVV
jgi:hypothetical protein